jgi:hypothetical protein
MTMENLPEVFLLDAQPWLDGCTEIIPCTSNLRMQIPSQLMLAIAMRLVLDYIPMRGSGDTDSDEVCMIANSYASEDISRYRYAFSEEVMVALYQWYFQTYLLLFQELNHFFPRFFRNHGSLSYTVKLYGALLRFDRIPTSRDYTYVSNRAT